MRLVFTAAAMATARHFSVWGVSLVLTLSGCDWPTDPTRALLFELELSRDVVLPGDTLHIVVTATNPTSRAIPLPEPCPVFGFRVFDSTGTRVAPPETARCASISGPPDPVPAGGSRSVSFPFTASRTYPPAQMGAATLVPGDYVVLGGLHGEPDLLATSPRVTLRVLEP